MVDPLSLVSTYGLKVIGGYALAHIAWKCRPKRENFPELMRITFIRTGLFTKVTKGKHVYEQTPKLISFEQMEWGFVFKYRLIPGLSTTQYVNKAEEIGTAFNGEAVIYGEGNELTIEILRLALPDLEYWDIDKIKADDMSIPIPLGYTRKGFEVVDLVKAPHGMVGGQSGSGKSVFVRGTLTTLAKLRTPQQLTMTLIDLKHGVELGMFKDLPHVTGFAKKPSEVMEVLNQVNSMMDERGELFDQSEVNEIALYNQLPNVEKLPYHLVLVDELAELDDKALEIIDRIARLARFTGIHMLLATQRPDREVMPGGIKANIPLAIAFKCKNATNSKILLDHGGAAQLPPIQGRCIIQYNGERQAQSLLLDEHIAKQIIKPLEIKGEKVNADKGERNQPTKHYI